MEPHSIFENALYAVDETPSSKEAVLRKIAAMAADRPVLSGYTEEDLFTNLLERERIGSTGFENGAALPHCALEKAEDFVTGVLVVPGGVNFDAVDGKKSVVFAFIIGPASERNTHIQLLSAYSRIFSDPSAIKLASKAADGDHLKTFFIENAQEIEDSNYLQKRKPKNLVLMVLQNKEYFEEFLQILAATANAAITVVESSNAGSFLHRMPLFSSFWSETQSSYNKIIIATVEREKCNDLIRRLNTSLKNFENPQGVLITVQELTYTIGSLEL